MALSPTPERLRILPKLCVLWFAVTDIGKHMAMWNRNWIYDIHVFLTLHAEWQEPGISTVIVQMRRMKIHLCSYHDWSELQDTCMAKDRWFKREIWVALMESLHQLVGMIFYCMFRRAKISFTCNSAYICCRLCFHGLLLNGRGLTTQCCLI
jgi:hypothetical protein